MKVNINKLQGGGLVGFTPIIKSAPAAAAPAPAAQTSKETGGLLDDDIYKELIKSGGLVNDVNSFVAEISAIESDPLAFLSPGNVGKSLRVVAKVNELKQNKMA